MMVTIISQHSSGIMMVLLYSFWLVEYQLRTMSRRIFILQKT